MRHFWRVPFRGLPWAPASSYQSRARSTVSPWRLAGLAAFPDVALESILEYGLCVSNLVDVYSVCRQWMKATQVPISWGGKKVFIEGARGFTRELLSAWLPRWRLADRVHLHLTYSQTDLLAAPLTASHAIVFLIQNEGHRVRNVSWRQRGVGADGARADIRVIQESIGYERRESENGTCSVFSCAHEVDRCDLAGDCVQPCKQGALDILHSLREQPSFRKTICV